MKIKLKKVLNEGIDELGQPDLKYYAFDWDDNILEMPTKIIVLNENDEEVGMSTEDFAEHRQKIGKEDFEYNGQIIIGYASNPYRNFTVMGDKQFIIDCFFAKQGPSWDDFVECINGGSIFSIITARGHRPDTLKEGVYNLIVKDHMGLNKDILIENLIKYRDLSGQETNNKKQLINDYLDLCKFHPVTYGEGNASNPEEGKVKALKEFITYVKDISNRLGKKAFFKNDVKNNFIPQIGFSDDDPGNIDVIKDKFKDEESLDIFLTKGGKKEKV